MISNRRCFGRLALPAVALGVLLAGWQEVANAQADNYPSKPVKVILPVAAGGATDRVIRMIGKRLSDEWNQPLVIEAKPGATGVLGAEVVARSPSDGYTALFASTTFIQAPALFQKVPYDYLRDFAPVSLTTLVAPVLVVSSQSRIRSLQDYLAAGTVDKPVNYGSVGLGSTLHIYGEILARDSGAHMVHVPYRGEQAIITDIVGGHLDSSILSITSALGLIKSGQLRPIAVIGSKRSVLIPETPAFAELGYSRLNLPGWFGMLMPARTPAAIIDKMSGGIHRIISEPDIRNAVIEMGLEPVGSTPREYAETIAHDFLQWQQLIREVGANGGPQ